MMPVLPAFIGWHPFDAFGVRYCGFSGKRESKSYLSLSSRGLKKRVRTEKFNYAFIIDESRIRLQKMPSFFVAVC